MQQWTTGYATELWGSDRLLIVQRGLIIQTNSDISLSCLSVVWAVTWTKRFQSHDWREYVETVLHYEFEVITVVTLKSIVIWDMMVCSLVEVHGCFRRTCCICFACHLLLAYSSALKIEAVHSSEMFVVFTRLHGVTLQNIIFFLCFDQCCMMHWFIEIYDELFSSLRSWITTTVIDYIKN